MIQHTTTANWLPYDTNHLVDGYSGMIVPNTADLTDLRVGDVKGFFPPLEVCVDCLRIMDVSEHNYGTPKAKCCYHCYINIETETFNQITRQHEPIHHTQHVHEGIAQPQ